MQTRVDNGAGTIDVLVGAETDPLVRFKIAQYAIRYGIEGVTSLEQFNEAMQDSGKANSILTEARKYHFTELEYRLACLKDAIGQPISPVQPDNFRPVRDALAIGGVLIYGAIIMPEYAENAAYLALGIGALLGTFQLIKVRCNKAGLNCVKNHSLYK